MITHSNKPILLTFLLFCGLIVKGQTDTMTVIPLQEVIITSQREAQSPLLIPYSVSSMGRWAMEEYSLRTAPEALTGVNGVFVQKTNHGGGSPFLRGLTGNQTLLVVDGIRLNNSIYRYGPNQYMNTLDPFSVQKMEVAKGTGSVQYGTDAMGGVIQVFTKEPEFQQRETSIHAKALARYMSGDMEKSGRGELEVRSSKVAALLGATRRSFGDLIGGRETGRQSPSGYDEQAFDAKVMAQLKPAVLLTLASQMNRQEHVPLYHKIVLENYLQNEFNPQQRMLSYARLKIKGHHRLLNSLKLTASWQNSEEGRLSRRNESSVLVREKDKVNTLGFTMEVSSKPFNAWTATSGVEVYHDRVGSTRSEHTVGSTSPVTEKRGLYPDQSTYGNYSLFTLHRLSAGKWILDGGIRLNSFMISISDPTVGDVKITPEAFVFNTSLMYNLDAFHRVYGALSSGFRAPNIDDMGTIGIVDFRYEQPAYDLKPEQSLNYELGYKFTTGSLQGTLSAYHMNLRQLITRVAEEGQFIDGYQVYRKENVEKAAIKGFEAMINWKLISSLELNSGISYTYGQNKTKGEPLRRIPPLNARTAGTYRYGKVYATAELLVTAKQDRLAQGDKSDNRIPQGGTPGWQVVNLYAGIHLSPFKLTAGIQNLGDEDYRTHGSGINGVGRSGFISVEFSF
ncbi:MAG TPA: TonB-dependent receptor [Prolixibacteraceae bacterium]|nr:TonB-dependent receptor [Prolixibacteraceae bacterium]